MNFQVVNLRGYRSGGNGDLYLGQRSDTGEWVIVKFLREYHLPHCRKAFAREVRVLQRKSPGMVPLLGWNLVVERPFYVMPYFEGGALSQHAGRLGAPQLQQVAENLAVTLATLHTAFDLHGDFKPDNVLLTKKGLIQVADPLGNGTLFTILFAENRGGTPGYMAPEIIAGATISRASDVYSYGATIYHLLTGKVPQHGQRLDPASEGCGYAPPMCELVTACCDPNPSVRPTMQEVLQMLRGKSWASIKESRKQREEFVKGAFVFGGLIVLGAGLAKSLQASP
jgi:eukaryotic-like serine/threonine-protein kinase